MIALLTSLILIRNLSAARAETVTVGPALLTFAQLTNELSTNSRRVLCEPALKQRACAIRLTSRSWDDVRDIFATGLGLVFQPVQGQSVDTYRLVEPLPLRLRRAKMRKQLLKFYVDYDRDQAGRVMALLQATNRDQLIIQKQVDDLDRRVDAAKPGPEKAHLNQELGVAAHALGYSMGMEQFPFDAYAFGCPEPPEDLLPPADIWTDLPFNEIPAPAVREVELQGEPGKFKAQNCLFRWHLRRSPFGVSFSPQWNLVGSGCQVRGGQMVVKEIRTDQPGHVLKVLNLGDSEMGWAGFGDLAELDEEQLDRETESFLAEPSSKTAIKDKTANSVPGVLLAWSKSTGRDFLEELMPQADGSISGPFSTIALAIASCPQIALKPVKNCVVAIDKLQFLDEVYPLPLEAILETRQVIANKGIPDQVPEEAFRAYMTGATGEAVYPWLWMDFAPSSYLGVPVANLDAGMFAFSLWDHFVKGKSVGVGPFWLKDADAADMATILAVCRSHVDYYQGSLPGFSEILAGEDFVVGEKDTGNGVQIQAGLSKHAPDSKMLFSFCRFIRS